LLGLELVAHSRSLRAVDEAESQRLNIAYWTPTLELRNKMHGIAEAPTGVERLRVFGEDCIEKEDLVSCAILEAFYQDM
jgi:hypothetical protein